MRTADRPVGCEKPHKIVLCHLESLVGLPALNKLFADCGAEIGLVLASHRFGPPHGGPIKQLVHGVRRSGWRLTLWLGFDIVSAQIVSAIARWTKFLRRREVSLATLRELASRHSARLVEVNDINARSTYELVKAYAPDFVIVMNFDQILKSRFISLPRRGVLNIHPSLLPQLRGPCPAFWGLNRGQNSSGATVHFIEDEAIDAGRVVAQVELPIGPRTTVAELTELLFASGAAQLRPALEALDADPSFGRQQQLGQGEYLGFPDRNAMGASWRSGVRLCRSGHILRLLFAALGVVRYGAGADRGG